MIIPVTFNGDPNQPIGSFSTDDHNLLTMLTKEMSFELRPVRGVHEGNEVKITELTLMYFEARPKHRTVPLKSYGDSSKTIGKAMVKETEEGIEVTGYITDPKMVKALGVSDDRFSVIKQDKKSKKKKKGLKIRCDRCGGKLKKPGGILLGPPNKKGKVRKYHLCLFCHTVLEDNILQIWENFIEAFCKKVETMDLLSDGTATPPRKD